MFRSRYFSFKTRQNYIRNPRNILNTPLDSKKHANKETGYKKTNDHKMPNDDTIPDDNELLRGEEINYRSSFNEKIMDEEEMPVDYSNEVSSEEESDFLDNKILDNEEIPLDYDSEISNEESDLFDKDILDNDEMPQMPSVSSEFALYFKNITEALMFFWIQKHKISTQAYDELVDIIRHPQFKNEDVITNIRRFRKYRQRLLLLPIKTRNIHILNKKTPSTFKDTKEMYYLSITDIIWHSLNNPSLFDQMYFGP
ncbi:7063_t:CDS:2, partial [Gigaspora rosea]